MAAVVAAAVTTGAPGIARGAVAECPGRWERRRGVGGGEGGWGERVGRVWSRRGGDTDGGGSGGLGLRLRKCVVMDV